MNNSAAGNNSRLQKSSDEIIHTHEDLHLTTANHDVSAPSAKLIAMDKHDVDFRTLYENTMQIEVYAVGSGGAD